MPAKGKPKTIKKSPSKNSSGTKKKVKPTKDASAAKKKAKPTKDVSVAKNKIKPTKKSRISKKKTNLLKLYSTMNKLTIDAVDKEVVKRFKVLIDSSQDDITKTSLNIILKDVKNVELSSFNESLQAYIKHYLFMVKRASK